MENKYKDIVLHYSRYPSYKKHSIRMLYIRKDGFPGIKSVNSLYSEGKSQKDLVLEMISLIRHDKI